MTEQREPGSQHPAQPDDFEPNPKAVRRISAHLWGEDFRNLKAAVESFPNGYTVVPKEVAASAPTPAEPLDVLLHPVITYLEHFVNADEAEADGFDVAAWCDNARALLARSEPVSASSDAAIHADSSPRRVAGGNDHNPVEHRGSGIGLGAAETLHAVRDESASSDAEVSAAGLREALERLLHYVDAAADCEPWKDECDHRPYLRQEAERARAALAASPSESPALDVPGRREGAVSGKSNRVVASIIDTDRRELHRMEPRWRDGVFEVTHSCGDCGFAGDYEDFQRHLRRRWHRLVITRGMDAALGHQNARLPDARRAVHIFREGGAP